MSDEEIVSLNRMKLFVRSSDLSVVTAKDMDIVVTLVEKQFKEIEEAEQKEKKAYIDGINVAHELCNKYWKDKIKARIKELEEYLYKGNIKDDFLMIRIKAKIQELQSLLEKE